MRKFNVCVYGICKNESQFVDRWMDSMAEADQIVVLDTGSTDDTVQRLRNRGAQVRSEVISPWRFDVARNRALELVPVNADICVCTDLDEVFRPGWRSALEAVWKPEAGQATYRYTWSFNPDGSEGVVFWPDKIHARYGYRWHHPVHEVIRWVGDGSPGMTVCAQGVQLNHYPDSTKSRAQYLPLLELSVQEDPEDDRNVHYLGREYLYYGDWQRCIDTLTHHLRMPRAKWIDERCASMRYIAKAYAALGNDDAAQQWFLRAVAEAPHLREPWLDYAVFANSKNDWHLVAWLVERALAVTERPRTYITEATSWGSLPYDLSAVAHYFTGDNRTALQRAEQALALEPDNKRIKNNVSIIKKQAVQ